MAEAAHIIGFSKDGPRPERDIPEDSINDINNLMLLCRICHTPVIDANEEQYTVDRLRQMKRQHEERIERVTAIGQDRASHLLLYGANVADHDALITYQTAASALIDGNSYPASRTPIALGTVNSSFRDRTKEFWDIESKQLEVMVAQLVKPRLRAGDIEHLSMFALAPQPLLVKLGFLLCDVNYNVSVYQLHREPPGWSWQTHPKGFEYIIERPQEVGGEPALVLALSAAVVETRITEQVGTEAAIWRITIPAPDRDYLKSAAQLQQFRELIRPLLDEIKDHYPRGTMLNIFPVAPVAVCVELGRAIQPKPHMPMRLWDENKDLGGFVHALDINLPTGDQP